MTGPMLDFLSVVHSRRSVGVFSFFTDEALEALAPAIDTFSADVVAGREPQTSIVHEYNCEVGHRRNQRDLAERRAQRGGA